MKLVSFEAQGDVRVGAVIEDGRHVVDLRAALEQVLRMEGDGRAAIHAGVLIPGDMTEFLAGGAMSMTSARRALDGVTSPGFPDGAVRALASVRLLAPVPRPGKVFGIGGNYPELKKTWPTPPRILPIFQRTSSSIVGPESDVVVPAPVTYFQPEMEVCAVVGRRCRRVPEAEAYEVIVGYMIGNDLSDIDVLMREWVTRKRPDLADYGLPTEAPYNLGFAFQSKAWDASAPTGPYLVTADEVDPNDLDFEFRVNGKLMQSGNTSEMIVKIPQMVAYLSDVCTLEPGDIIFTGARGHLPPVRVGDVMEHKITNLGSFTSRCVADSVRAER